METKLLIVNNGLKDLRGHYFETGISTAAAARAAGLRPILAAHATCPDGLVPPEIECLPLCRTDHWVVGGVATGPDLLGVRCRPAAMTRTPIDRILESPDRFAEYLAARFSPPELTPAAVTVPKPSASPLPPKLGRKARLKRFVPPLLWSLARACRPRVLARTLFRTVKPLLPPVLTDLVKAKVRRPAAVPPPAANPVAVVTPAVEDPLLTRLRATGLAEEFGYVRAYEEDLEQLLGLTGIGPGDHVFIPTAHGRELVAVREIVDKYGADGCPTFHLEFRHALDGDPNGRLADLPPYTRAHAVFFELYRRAPEHPSVRLYTDTEELTRVYGEFSGLAFATLPIPFRAELIAERCRRPGEPLCLTFIGDVRDEKGYPWLPALVDALRPEAEAGRVRFAFQSTLVDQHNNPASVAALSRLRAAADPFVDLVGLRGPLHPDEYYALVSGADVLLCPYDPVTYQCRSSGTMTEAAAAGIPTVVPADTWLERQQPAGTGTRFFDLSSFVSAVKDVVGRYGEFRAAARAHRDAWRRVHNPAALIRALVGPAPVERVTAVRPAA